MSKLGTMMTLSRIGRGRVRRGRGDFIDPFSDPWNIDGGDPFGVVFGSSPILMSEPVPMDSFLPVAGGSSPVLAQLGGVAVSALEKLLARLGLGAAAAEGPAIAETAETMLAKLAARLGISVATLQKILTAAGIGAVSGGAATAVEKLLGMHGGGGRKRYRRMNVLNPRALRRSMRRVKGFARFAHDTMSFTKTHRLKTRRRR